MKRRRVNPAFAYTPSPSIIYRASFFSPQVNLRVFGREYDIAKVVTNCCSFRPSQLDEMRIFE